MDGAGICSAFGTSPLSLGKDQTEDDVAQHHRVTDHRGCHVVAMLIGLMPQASMAPRPQTK